MDIDLDLYRHEVRVSTNPLVHRAASRRASLVRLSAIDIAPDHPNRRLFSFMGLVGRPHVRNVLRSLAIRANMMT